MAFEIKAHDRRPFFVCILKDNYGQANEAAVDLTTAGSAVFNMWNSQTKSTAIARGSAAIAGKNYTGNPTSGEVTYQWGATDTQTPGSYQAEIEVIWSDGKSETFPGGPGGGNYWDVTITQDIA